MKTLELSVDTINAVLGYLDQHPHNQVRGLIDKIHQELQGQQIKDTDPESASEIVAE